MTTRGTLLAIGVLLLFIAAGCWLRGKKDGRLRKEGLMFFFFGLPFFVAGGFYTASSYPQDVVATPTPLPTPTRRFALATPAPTPVPTPTPKPLPRAEPVPTPSDPKLAFEAAVAAAQRSAVARYPDLGFSGTAFNQEFVAAYQRKKSQKPEFLKDPNWPLILADDIAQKLGLR